MRLGRVLVAALFASSTVGVSASYAIDTVVAAKTPGERSSGYGYVPLDPLAIGVTRKHPSCAAEAGINKEPMPLLDALPDIAVRFAVADVDASGGLNFGPSKMTMKGETYKAVLDYVNVDAVPVDFHIRKFASPNKDGSERMWVKVSDLAHWNVQSYEARIAVSDEAAPTDPTFERVTIPVYVGVGLRLSADIRALKANVSLSGLGTIGAQAEASALTGTLTVQTLGVNGKSIAVALPLPNKLDQTTIESAILSIGSTRAMLYTSGAGGDQVTSTPRIVGLYSPVGADPRLVNAVYSELSRRVPSWDKPCRVKTS